MVLGKSVHERESLKLMYECPIIESCLYIAFLVLVSYMDNGTLYCAHKDLIDSRSEPTAFCVITGIFDFFSAMSIRNAIVSL